MNYEKHYLALIDKARSRTLTGYKERHHAIPKCAGGTDDPHNIIELTAEEHFLAHQLLLKMFWGTEYQKQFAFACHAMTRDPHGRRVNNKLFGWLRKAAAEASSEHNRDRPRTAKELADYESRRGKKKKPFSAEGRANISAAKLGKKTGKRPTTTCPHCGVEGGGGAMVRHHFARCKSARV